MSDKKPKTKKDAFLLASRQVQNSLAGRISNLKKEYEKHMNSTPAPDRLVKALEIQTRIDELEKARTHLRNSLLWDSSWN